MKKILLALCLFSMVYGAQAQYQLENPGFDGTWSSIQPYTGGNTTTSGTTPSGWCVANVAGYKVPFLGWMGKTTVGTPDSDRSGASNSTSCKLENINTFGNVIPGYVTLGTSWNTADTSGNNGDGGSFGGVSFTGTPDALEFYYQRTASDNSQPATVVAYMWKGSTTQSQVPVSIGSSPTKVTMTNRDRNILGMTFSQGGSEVTKSSDFSLIASLMSGDEHEVKLTEIKDSWTKATCEFTYHNATDKPTMINVVFGAMDYFTDRSNHKSGNTLTVDDVKFLYYSEIASCSYDGTDVVFENGTATVDEFYDADKLSVTSNGHGATIEKSFNEETQLLSITVKGEDISINSTNYHTYTIQFKSSSTDPIIPGVVETKIYSEDLYITIGNITTDKQVADVVVETLDNGNINFALNNFILDDGTGVLPIGNIAVNNIELADGTFEFQGGIQLAEGDDPAYEGQWFGPDVTTMCGGSVPLDLKGQFLTEDHIVVYINIDITDILGYAVEVHLGYDAAPMAVNATAQYGTFCAPFDVEVPAGVTAYTVPSIDGNLLNLQEVGGTIPAKTPVVLYAESGLEKVMFFGLAEEGNPVADVLTGVYENTVVPVGSYVLQNLNGKVGFYLVAEGKQPTLGANRCYLTVPASGVKAFYFDGNDATGISDVDANVDANEVIYNIAGQRINKLQKGINIINGKKILK